MPEMMGIGPDGKWKTIAVDENGNILASGIGGGGGGGGDASAANQVTQTTALNNIRNEQATASEQAAQTAVLGNILTANQSPRPDLVVGPSSITTIVATLNTGGANIVNQAVGISGLDGRATVAIQITGTHTGVLTVQGRLDGTNWVNLGAHLSAIFRPGHRQRRSHLPRKAFSSLIHPVFQKSVLLDLRHEPARPTSRCGRPRAMHR